MFTREAIVLFSEMEDVPEAAFLPPGRSLTVMTIVVSSVLADPLCRININININVLYIERYRQ